MVINNKKCPYGFRNVKLRETRTNTNYREQQPNDTFYTEKKIAKLLNGERRNH